VHNYWQITGVSLDAEAVTYNLTLTNLVTLNSYGQQTFHDNKLTLFNLNNLFEIHGIK